MTDRPAPWASASRGDQIHRGARHGVTVRDLVVGVVAGLLVLGAQTVVDGRRDDEADRRDNLRFVREMAAYEKVDEVSLSGFDLSNRNLSRIDLSRANLVGSDLSGADLFGSNLEDAIMNGSTLTGADLFNTQLTGAQAMSTNLSGVDMSFTDISGADFTYSDLSGAQLGEKEYPRKPNRTGAEGEIDFIDTDLSGAHIAMDLRNARFVGTKLYGADLRDAKLPTRIAPEPAWPTGQGRMKSLCFDDKTVWPEDFPQELLPELRCEAMKD